MMFEQFYLLFIYILFIELTLVTIVAFALFVALVVTLKKLYNNSRQHKNTPLSGQ